MCVEKPDSVRLGAKSTYILTLCDILISPVLSHTHNLFLMTFKILTLQHITLHIIITTKQIQKHLQT